MLETLPPAAVLSSLLEALESADVGCTVVVDHRDRLERVYSNAAIGRILGRDPDAMARLPVMDGLTPEERTRLASLRVSMAADPASGPPVLETKFVRPDGTAVPVEVAMGHAYLDGARATFVFMRDISTKHALATALSESEERFRCLSEASPDSITVTSNGKYLYANPIALGHLGLSSADELPSVDPWTLLPPERRAAVAEHLERVRRGESNSPITHRIVAPDGKETFLESSLSLTSMNGAEAIISYTRDITERVRLQAELMKNDRLASVGVLAAGVAHELNTPLAALGLQVRKLCKDADAEGLPDTVKLGLERIDEAATRMNAIVADLLFMARPVDQLQSHVDVAQILKSTIALLRAGIAQCPPVRMEIDVLPLINGYSSKLGQVFLNVLRNAVEAVEGLPHGDIQVRARCVDDAVEIAIADNGVGIPSEVMPRMTQPFFTTKMNGTGLGLWISQGLMTLHGGTLEVTSVAGAGTTVTLRLPQSIA